MVGLASESQEWARACRLAGAAASLGQAIGAPAPPVVQAWLEGWLAPARTALGEPAFLGAVGEGQAMTPEQAVADALDADPGVTA